jgi:hypothetical protein
MAKDTPLRKRLTPSVPYTIEFNDEKGGYVEKVQLAFDLNAIAAIEEATGVNILNNWLYIYKLDATNFSLFFWAALLPYQPKYNSKEGLEAVRSYFDLSNWEPAGEKVWEAYKLCLDPIRKQAVEEALTAATKAIETGVVPEESGKAPLDQTVQTTK